MVRAFLSPMVFALLVLGACSTPSGTSPHEMSAAGHEQAAAAEQTQASEHAASYDEQRRAAVEQCRGGAPGGSICWTSIVNPTEAHRREAERHADAAVKHRAAIQALAEAEESWCANVPDLDRDVSPFAHREDISSVAPLYVLSRPNSKAFERRTLVGARIVFRPVFGLTQERLQAMLNCHLARNAVVGHDMPEMDYCPLVPKDVSAQVVPGGSGQFLVDVESKNPSSAQMILDRASKIGVARTAPVGKR